MKRNALALGVFLSILVTLLSIYSTPNVTAAALITATASPTATTPKPTETPSQIASPKSTATVSSATDVLTALVEAALEQNAALNAYRMDALMTTGPISPTQPVSPTVLLDLFAEQSDGNIHVLSTSRGADPEEMLKVGDRFFRRYPTESGEGTWYIIEPDLPSQASIATPSQLIAQLLADPLEFSRVGTETLNDVSCDILQQDRAAVIQFFLALSGAGTFTSPEEADASFDRAEILVWVCENGYLPRLEIHVTSKPRSSSEVPSALDAVVRLYDLNGDIEITAPANAISVPTPMPFYTETPMPTQTPHPTLAPAQATATATAALGTLNATTGWEVVLSDTFDSNSNNWEVGEGKSVEGGKYVWNINDRVNIYRGLPEIKGQTDFVASIDARLVTGSQDCGMGLTFRNGIDDFSGSMTDYIFYIQNDGRWGFDIIHSPDPGIAQYGTSNAIVPRALNRIQVIAQGSQLTFFVNGKYIGQAEDATLSVGKAGAAVWVLGPGGCEVEFDNFQVSAAPPPAILAETGQMILTDWTADNPNKWPTGEFSVQNATGSREVVGTKYMWQTTSASDVTVVAAPVMQPLVDFDVSVDALQLSDSVKSKYGLMFRHSDPGNEYMFMISGWGAYSLSYNHDGDYQVLSFPTSSSAIKVGEFNRLRVIGAGSHFVFLINGEVVAEIDDETLSQGTVGITAEGYDEENPDATFEFSNFVLRELAPTPTAGVTPVVAQPTAATPNTYASATLTASPTAASLSTPAAQASCGPVETKEDEGRSHLSPSETPVYKSNPPTSGTHHPVWHEAGIYDEPIDVTMEVHNLEHGYVIMHYNNISAEQVEQLGEIVRRDFRKLILAPFPSMTDKITLTAWNHIQVCTGVDGEAIQMFIDTFRDQGPETGAP